MKKKTYKILWIEYHYIENWIPAYYEGDAYSEEAEALAIKEMCDSVPNGKCTGGFQDGCMEIEAWDTFRAENIEEAKDIVDSDYLDVEIFTVYNEDGTRAFTEEDYI